MKFIIETISGRKGIKNFNNLYEYIDFMTNNGNKIKTIKESELPYNDKPVKLPSVSTSKGWKQIDSSAFGDIGDKPEKGDCLLPSGNQGVFKNNAQFEPSKSSETPDKSESPKIDNSPVKTDNEGEEKDLPKFKYEDSEKSESSEENSEKDDKSESEKDDKKEKNENLEEGFKDNLKKAGKYAKGAIAGAAMAGALASNAHGMEDPYYDGATQPFDNSSYEQVVNINGNEYTQEELKKLQQEYNLSDEEMQQIMNGEDPYYDGARQPFDESKNNLNSEIEEALRLAGVQLNEMEEQVNNEEDGEVDEKTGKTKLFEEDPLEEAPMSDEEFDNLKTGDKVNWDLAKYKGNYTVKKDKDGMSFMGDEGQGNDFDMDKRKDYVTKYYSKGSKESPSEDSLEYAEDQVKAWENEREMAEYDDSMSANRRIREADRNLSYWKKEVEKRQSNESELNESENEALEEEITPSRLWKYQEHPDMNFAILSADRSERTPEENAKLTKELKKDIKDMGYWYTELKGGYVEVSNDKRVPVDGENSFIIPKMTKEEAMKLGMKYDQDTVMFKDAKKGTLEYIITNERAGNIGDTDSSFETQAGKNNFSVSRGSNLDYYSRLPKSNKPDLKIGFNWKE